MANGLIFSLFLALSRFSLRLLGVPCASVHIKLQRSFTRNMVQKKSSQFHSLCTASDFAFSFCSSFLPRALCPVEAESMFSCQRMSERRQRRQSAHFRISHYNYGLTMANDNVGNNNNHVICSGVMRTPYCMLRGLVSAKPQCRNRNTGNDSNSNGIFITRSIYRYRDIFSFKRTQIYSL